MTIKEVAQDLWPAWMMGLAMLYLVKNSKYANVIRVDKKGLLSFVKFLTIVTVIRFLVLKYLSPPEELEQIHKLGAFLPWQVCFGVFWEDMCHTVPLVLLGRMFYKTKWYRWIAAPLVGLVMFSFGSGHVYQGLFNAACISLYIPFTLRMGKKYGFGTVMICHMLWDLTTMLSFKLL
jgi:hypothetical protein